ncbi:MAG: prolyl oligopeptidase family serine peptidase [Planctomycetota bacterium]
MSLRELFKSTLVLSVVLFCSCAHYKCDPAYTGPRDRSAEMLEYYGYPKQTIEAKVERIHDKKRYVVERVEFPSTLNVFGKENIKVDCYIQKKEGRFPTVLVLPIDTGVDLLAKSFARHFASNGLNCAVLHNRDIDLEEIDSAEAVENHLRQTVLDSRQVLDYLEQREKVDASRLGCLGMSIGGVRAMTVAGADERIKCSVIGLAGGSMADIALTSKLKNVREYMNGLTELGISPEALRIELEDKVRTDPVKMAEYADARDVLMYIAMFDRVIPRKCGDRLREAAGKPEAVYVFSGHFTSLLYWPYAERNSLAFFKRKFHVR